MTEAETQAIEAAIATAEGNTSAEIVPVISSCSGRYDRAEDIVGVLVALGAVTAVWLLFQSTRPGWSARHEIVLGLGWILLTFVLGFALGAAAASRFPPLRLPFIHRREMEEEVLHRAAEAFYRFGVGKTAAGTGVLIYVSLYERRVVVQGDGPISERLGQEQWQEVRDLVLGGIRQGRRADGLKNAILRAGELLAQHFPRGSDDQNEIPNRLHFVDMPG